MIYLTYLSLIFTMLCWGGTFIAGRVLAGEVSPLAAACIRFGIASLALALLVRLIDGRISIPSFSLWPRLIALALTGVFSYNILFFTGLQHLEAGRASLIIALNPLAITCCATLFLHESLNFRQMAGICISLVGALFVISNGHPQAIFNSGFGIGELTILGCVASWAAYSIIGRTVLKSISALSAVFYSSLCGTLLLLPFALFEGSILHAWNYSSHNWGSLIYLGFFGTAIGFSLYYQAIRKIGASRSSVFINLVPFFSILLSAIFLGETIKPAVLSGGLLLLTGVTLTNATSRSPEMAQSAPKG